MTENDNFDWQFYLDYYKDITRPSLIKNQLRCFRHYQKFGKHEGRKFTKFNEERTEEAGNMNWRQYLKDYPDLMVEVQENEKGARFHWNKIGKNENRLCNKEMLRDDIRKHFLEILEREATDNDIEIYFKERIQGKSVEWMIRELTNSEEKIKLDKKKDFEKNRYELNCIQKMIKKCFKDILEREINDETLNSYSDQVLLGLTEVEIREKLNNSSEKKKLEELKLKLLTERATKFTIKNYYNILNRRISNEDLKSKVDFLINGDIDKNEDLIIDEILSCEERKLLDEFEDKLDEETKKMNIIYNINLILKKDLFMDIMRRKNYDENYIEERNVCLESLFLGFSVEYYLEKNNDLLDKDWDISRCFHHILNFGKYDNCFIFPSLKLCQKYINSVNYVLHNSFYNNKELAEQLFEGCISLYDIFTILKNKPYNREIIYLDDSTVKLKNSRNNFLKDKRILVQGLCKNISNNFDNIKKLFFDLTKNRCFCKSAMCSKTKKLIHTIHPIISKAEI